MDYTLAKELKEAGFPKNWNQFDDHDPILLKLDWDMYGQGYSPTLSELIEACGLPFSLGCNTENNWYTKRGFTKNPLRTRGRTPEEAVARLWLSLNKQP